MSMVVPNPVTGHRESTRVKMGRDWSDSPASKGRGKVSAGRQGPPSPSGGAQCQHLSSDFCLQTWQVMELGGWKPPHYGTLLRQPRDGGLLSTPDTPGLRPCSALPSPAISPHYPWPPKPAARFTEPPNWLHFLGRTPGDGLTKAHAEEKPALIPAGACR